MELKQGCIHLLLEHLAEFMLRVGIQWQSHKTTVRAESDEAENHRHIKESFRHTVGVSDFHSYMRHFLAIPSCVYVLGLQLCLVDLDPTA